MNAKPIRTFIALELNQAFKDEIKKVQASLKKIDADVSWVRPENCHLTLKFLGNTQPKHIEPAVQIMERIASSFSPFVITLTGLGAFPKTDNPKTIWIGCSASPPSLEKIALQLENKMQNLGFVKEDRKFKPHITVGRGRSQKNKLILANKIQSLTINTRLEQSISHLTLFESTLTQSGPIYNTLHKANLKKYEYK